MRKDEILVGRVSELCRDVGSYSEHLQAENAKSDQEKRKSDQVGNAEGKAQDHAEYAAPATSC